MTEIVTALIMIVNGEIIEHRIVKTMSYYLIGNRNELRKCKKKIT